MSPSRRGRLVALEGPSAVGKSTLGRAVAAASGFVLLPEALAVLRPPPRLSFRTPRDLASIEARLMSAERRRARTAERLRDEGVDVLLDTGPIGPATYSLGWARQQPGYGPTARRVVAAVVEDLQAHRLPAPERVVYLDAGLPTLRERARTAKGSHPPHLTERHWAVARFERSFWRAVARQRPDGVRTVSVATPLPAAARRVDRAIHRPGPPLTLAHLVAALRAASVLVEGRPPKATVKNRASSRRLPRR